MLLFCSPNANKSPFVEQEWTAFMALKKPVIPIFLDIGHIPPILSANVGCVFDPFNIKEKIEEIHLLITRSVRDQG